MPRAAPIQRTDIIKITQVARLSVLIHSSIRPHSFAIRSSRPHPADLPRFHCGILGSDRCLPSRQTGQGIVPATNFLKLADGKLHTFDGRYEPADRKIGDRKRIAHEPLTPTQ